MTAIIKFEAKVTPEQMSDLMVTALEGGINYWCGKVKKLDEPLDDDEYLSDVIGRGGRLKLYDAESDDTWILDQEMFLKGLKMYMIKNGYLSVEDLIDGHDAETADCIIQYAIFDEITFG